MLSRSFDHAAFNMLFSDLVENILSRAEHPGKCGDYIAEQIRSLIGVKTVIMLECPKSGADTGHGLLSVYPLRRKTMALRPEIERLATLSHDLASSTIIPSDVTKYYDNVYASNAATDEASCLLQTLGVGDSVILPLLTSKKRMGVILLLGVMDLKGVQSILITLDKLSSILALILQNSDLYVNMENNVQERTKELMEGREAISRALEEKNIMMKEIHHRVKNNLQIIISLLNLQMQYIIEPLDRVMFIESQNRIYSMALVHEELYKSEDLSSVDMTEYLPRLVSRITSTSSSPVTSEFVIEPIALSITQSIPLGLIVNELVMNSIKHAFPDGRTGKVVLSLSRSGETVELTVCDDGVGLPQNLDIEAPSSLGLTLVAGLVNQLRGEVLAGGAGQGACFTLRFPLSAR